MEKDRIIQKEIILYKGTLSFFALISNMAILIFSLFFLMKIGAIGFERGVLVLCLVSIYLWVVQKSFVYQIRESSVVSREGLFSQKYTELSLEKIEGVRVEQSILGKFLNYGDIHFTGSGIIETSFSMVDDPMSFRDHVISIQKDLKK